MKVWVLVLVSLCQLSFGFEGDEFKNDCVKSFIAHGKNRLSESEEKLFEKFHTMAMQGAILNSPSDIRDAIHSLGEFEWSAKWVYSAQWTNRVKQMLDYSLNPNLCLEPYNADVRSAYLRFIRAQAAIKTEDPLWDNEKVCQAISDASVYFLERGAHGLVQQFERFSTNFDCADRFRAWNRVRWDERFKK